MKRLLVCIAVLHMPLAGAAYRCVDEKGVTHVGDTPPAACANVVLYEIRTNGSLIRRIEPTPSPEQAKLRQQEAEKKREADKIGAEQKRKDAALLSTYSSEREFDVVLERTISPIRGRMSSASERIKAIEAREQKIGEEMEFYKAGKSKAAKKGEPDAPPPSLVAEQERLWHEKQSLSGGLAMQEKEIASVTARFDSDKKRWLRIKSGMLEAPAEAETRQAKKAY
jgi:hypothetical protein